MQKAKIFLSNIRFYLSSMFFIWISIFIFRNVDAYLNFLSGDAQGALLFLARLYSYLGFIYYVFISFRVIKPNRSFLILRGIYRYIIEFFYYIRYFPTTPELQLPRFEKKVKISILFYIVKFFYLPIMLNFMYANYNSLLHYSGSFPPFSIESFNNYYFSMMLPIIFFIDTLYFSFGYAFESKFLKNSVRSVEPTILGFAVAIICYPPFNQFVNRYIVWYPNNLAGFSSDSITFIVRIILVLLLLIYLWATIALGTKCSNLTNRGIVSKGPYTYIRHPAYIAKNLMWWITVIPIMNWTVFFSLGIWTFIYYLRAITEERHLIMDKDYQKYCNKVRYRFIPGIW